MMFVCLCVCLYVFVIDVVFAMCATSCLNECLKISFIYQVIVKLEAKSGLSANIIVFEN